MVVNLMFSCSYLLHVSLDEPRHLHCPHKEKNSSLSDKSVENSNDPQQLQQYLKMASRGNPNVPRKMKKLGNRAKVQRRNAGKITKNPRGGNSSTVLHPTGGPLAPLSSKKMRKLEKAQNHARQRALELAMAQEGEVTMTGTSAQGIRDEFVAKKSLQMRLQLRRARRRELLRIRLRRWRLMRRRELRWRRSSFVAEVTFSGHFSKGRKSEISEGFCPSRLGGSFILDSGVLGVIGVGK